MNKPLKRILCGIFLLLMTSTTHGAKSLASQEELYEGPEYAAAFKNPKDNPTLPNVLLIGDSISNAYTVDVRKLLHGKADVFRIPSNGKNTEFGLKNLDKWLKMKPGEWDIIHFNWGLWDLCYRNPKAKTQGHRDKINGTLTATPEQYRENMEQIVARLKQTDATLIWCATTPVPEFEAGRKVEDAIIYNQIAATIMKKDGIRINDLYAHAILGLPKIQKGEGDVHFTAEGSAYLAEKVAQEILSALNQQDGISALVPDNSLQAAVNYLEPKPFGDADEWAKKADNLAIGEWWKPMPSSKDDKWKEARQWIQSIEREKALAFALYTYHEGELKLSAQCFPLLPDEPKSVVLEFKRGAEWVQVDEQPVLYPGWDVHFRVQNWDASKDVEYRVRLGELSSFEGLVRKDPLEKDTIVVANMSCNSPKDKERFTRTQFIQNLKQQDPDLLFFAGDQNYTHEEATYGWLQFGVQFADIMKDRPTICIPDDHDVGHGNFWGEGGKKSFGKGGATDGGYMFPAAFVNMVERQQTWNLPDAFDPTPVKQGIGVYYTELNVGGISFAILEDRKFKSAPMGNIPKMGKRNDHINDPAYDRASVDLAGLKLLGDRQLAFLDAWARDWSGDVMKVALSQTAFCGAVHMHGSAKGRLLADLDCNGWPQSGRNRALSFLRAARATHLCGDQHLAVVVKHGIEGFRDGPMAFTSPALVNTIYGRWWWPKDEQPGGGGAIDSSLPWVGDYEDGLGNKITMLAYANPDHLNMSAIRKDSSRENRGDGYGLVRFNKKTGDTVFECWPRFSDISRGDSEQFLGWPIRFNVTENDGRKPVSYLKSVNLPVSHAVVELTDADTGELIYCYRATGDTFEAPVYAKGRYTLKAGRDQPNQTLLKNVLVSVE